jgi:hypothetical protein
MTLRIGQFELIKLLVCFVLHICRERYYMQILDGIRSILPGPLCLQANSSVLPETILPFDPTRLFFLVLWFYLCLYFIQHAQFSPLVPKKYKSVSYIISLVAGPILFLVLIIVDTAKKTSKSDSGFFQTIAEQLRNIITNIRSIRPMLIKQSSTIKLLDSSGRSIKRYTATAAEKTRQPCSRYNRAGYRKSPRSAGQRYSYRSDERIDIQNQTACGRRPANCG